MPFAPPNIEAVPIKALPLLADVSNEVLEGVLSDLPHLERTLDYELPKYELGYTLTHMQVYQGPRTVLQFDTTSVYNRHTGRSIELNHKDQKIVELDINRVELPNIQPVAMTLSRARLVTREEKQKPYRMKCGREAKWVVERDPREWDEFGKLGTWSRTLHVWWHQQVVPLAAFGFLLCLIGLVRFAKYRHAQNEEKAEDIEAAAALLDDDDEDFLDNASPAYLSLLPVMPGLTEEKNVTEDK